MALIKHVAEPGLDIRLALGQVRDEVLRNTRNDQEAVRLRLARRWQRLARCARLW